MRVETIGDATLYLGDCMEILPTLDKVDAVVTDPPFNVGKDFDNDNLSTNEWIAFCSNLAATISLIKPINVLIEVGKNDTHMRSAFDSFMRYRWAIALNYTNAMRNGAVGYSNFGLVLWYGEKCYMRFMDRIDCPLTSTKAEFSHPSPKEIEHYTRLVQMFSLPEHTILDPFMGSGTTGVACANLGRKFIGIEIEEKYFDIACERITAAYAQGRLFE
ncbi:site-specific DNA-methyltransferase [bacterium]|nr:site-specific DNA-methyltransferase [bacterium]